MKKNKLRYQEASNGLEAVEKYKDQSRNFDTILMGKPYPQIPLTLHFPVSLQILRDTNGCIDMSMPVLDGMSATRAIREHERINNAPRCCIIALTGLASSSAKLEAWSSGIDHFLTKPVNYKRLREILQSEEAQRQARRRNSEPSQDESVDWSLFTTYASSRDLGIILFTFCHVLPTPSLALTPPQVALY